MVRVLQMSMDDNDRIDDAVTYLQASGLLQGFQSVLEKLIEDGSVRLDKQHKTGDGASVSATPLPSDAVGGADSKSYVLFCCGRFRFRFRLRLRLRLTPPHIAIDRLTRPFRVVSVWSFFGRNKILAAATAVLSSGAPAPDGLRAPIDLYEFAAKELER